MSYPAIHRGDGHWQQHHTYRKYPLCNRDQMLPVVSRKGSIVHWVRRASRGMTYPPICHPTDGFQIALFHVGRSVTPLRQMHIFKNQWFLMEFRGIITSLIGPRGNMAIIIIISASLVLFCLIGFIEMATARFLTVQGISDHQFCKFQEIRNTSGPFQALV